jgi:hypothetical protein
MRPYRSMSLQELAIMDPVAAVARLMGVPISPVSYNAICTFSSFALNQTPQTIALDQIISKRTWIDNINYNLALPNAFVGNIFFPQSLDALKRNTGVIIQTKVIAGPRYVVSSTFMPLENYTNLYNGDNWTSGWVICPFQTITTDFVLTTAPYNDSSNTPPYIVTLTYNGFQIDNCECDDMSAADAQKILVAKNILAA